MAELDRVEFREIAPPRGSAQGMRVFDVAWPGGPVFARAEVFPGEVQWGVRLHDRAPELEDSDLLRLVARLLVWQVGCRADTIDVVLGRTHEHHALVRVGADYV